MNVEDLLPTEEELALFTPDWRMSQPALRAVAEHVASRKPQTILETGPGASSLIYLKYQQLSLPPVRYTILDESGPWHEKFLRAIKSFLNENLRIVATKLTAEYYYDVPQLPKEPAVYDLISLDGPADSDARGSLMALTLLNERVSSHTCVLVDDTHRPGEQAVVNWLQQLRLKRYGVEFVKTVISDDAYPRSSTFLTLPVL